MYDPFRFVFFSLCETSGSILRKFSMGFSNVTCRFAGNCRALSLAENHDFKERSAMGDAHRYC